MYVPPPFEEARPAEVERIIAEHPLGALTYCGPNGLDATHLPFVFRVEPGGKAKLIAHVARKNPIWQQIANETEILVIFQGHNCYISPNWYPSKQETHRQVPTWNYQVVHIHGKIRFVEDAKFVRAAVALLTHIHETRIAEAKPWSLGEADKAFIDQEIAAIVGIEIEVVKMVGKSKLSQNRQPMDREGAIAALRRRGETAVADAMIRAQPPSA